MARRRTCLDVSGVMKCGFMKWLVFFRDVLPAAEVRRKIPDLEDPPEVRFENPPAVCLGII